MRIHKLLALSMLVLGACVTACASQPSATLTSVAPATISPQPVTPTTIPTATLTVTPRPSTRTASPTLAPRTATRVPFTATATAETQNDELQRVAILLYARFNSERAKQNIAAFTVDPLLETMARERSQDMVTRDYFSHADPDTGKGLVAPLFEKYNYNTGIWGENIAVIIGETKTVEKIAKQFAESWLTSEGHARNILDPEFHRTGIGLARSADGLKIIATHLFAN